MPSLNQLEEQGRALLQDQKNLIADNSRTWAQKRPEYNKRDADIKAVLNQYEAQKATSGDPFARGSSGDAGGHESAAAIGHRAYGAAALPAMPSTRPSDAAMRSLFEAAQNGQPRSVAIQNAATETSSTFGGAPIEYVRQPITFKREPTRVADLFPTVAATSSTVDYYRLTGAAAAATVAEGALKPQSDVSAVLKVLPMTKVATWVAVTDEVLADFPSFQSVISEDLGRAVILAESDQVLNGNGTAPNMAGLLLAATGTLTQTVTAGTNPLDALNTAIVSLRTGASFVEPDAVLLNPVDFGKIRVVKSAGSGEYFAGSPFESGPPTLWGLKAVQTTAIAAGTAVVGNFASGGVMYVREGLNLRVDPYTLATSNTVRIIAEERVALAVTRPSNFVKLTGLNS